jgi:uncharacterized membrane protein
MTLKQRLTSRKLWIAVLTIAILVLNKQYNEAMGVAMVYLGVQGYVDSTTPKE